MNKYIYLAFVVFAYIATGSCGSTYGGGSGSGYAAAPANVYAAPSYTLGAGPSYNAGPAAPAAYATAAAAPGSSYGANPSYGAPKFTYQNAYATELYPGQQNYQTYNSAPTYSQVALPVVQSAPVAKLYVPSQQSYGGSSYGGSSHAAPASSYGGY